MYAGFCGSRAPRSASATITAAGAVGLEAVVEEAERLGDPRVAWSSSVIGSRIIATGLLAVLAQATAIQPRCSRRGAAIVQEAAREHRHLVDRPQQPVGAASQRVVAPARRPAQGRPPEPRLRER